MEQFYYYKIYVMFFDADFWIGIEFWIINSGVDTIYYAPLFVDQKRCNKQWNTEID